VQRRQLGQPRQLVHDLVVDDDRLPEARAAVNDAVGDRGDFGGNGVERLEPAGRAVRLDGRQLQARRAGVDDEDGARS
jgi:hypothetical protein